MRGRRVFVGGLVALLVAASCSSEDGGGDSSAEGSDETTETTAPLGPELEVDDSPLAFLVTAEDVAENGIPVGPSGSFPDTAPQITAVAFANDAGTVAVTWFQVPDEGDPAELFSHDVAVEAGQFAFSTGTSPGVLTAGTYRVEASLGGDEEVVEFFVEGSGGGASGDETPGRAAQGATGTPQPGDSGATSPSFDAADESVPQFWFVAFSPDKSASVVKLDVFLREKNPDPQPFTVGITASIGGRQLSRSVGSGPNVQSLELDPCRLGNDLPGTRIDFSFDVPAGVSAIDLIPSTPLTSPFTLTLGPDKTAPAITTFDTSRRDGDFVNEGDTIGFDVIGRDQKREGSTWQTGVKLLEAQANGRRVGRPVNGGADAPKCDDAARVLNLEGEYEVPNDPDPIIKLCAVAEDYAGNIGTKCHEYYAGEVWKGTFTYDFSGPGACSADYSVTLGVQDGEALGEITVDSSSCPGAAATDQITGTRTEESFSLHFFGPGEFPVPIRRNRATATFQSTPEEIRVLDIRCVTCD